MNATLDAIHDSTAVSQAEPDGAAGFQATARLVLFKAGSCFQWVVSTVTASITSTFAGTLHWVLLGLSWQDAFWEPFETLSGHVNNPTRSTFDQKHWYTYVESITRELEVCFGICVLVIG